MITETRVNVAEKEGVFDTVYVTNSEQTTQRIISDAEKSAKWTIAVTTSIWIGAFLVLVACLILAIVLHDNNSSYSSLNKVAEDAVISVPEYFDENEVWKVPSNIASGGRALLTMTGGGGGGCDGGAGIPGGGGNAGASVVEYPILLEADGQCLITIGSGGQRNQEGLATKLMCMSKDASKTYVDIELMGGRSGCVFFNGTQERRGRDDYPYISERFGGRPETGWLAESHPFGGPAGASAGGGAGSVFGAGGDTGNGAGVTGESGESEGSGGGGGGPGLGYGGTGFKGMVKIVYTVKIKN